MSSVTHQVRAQLAVTVPALGIVCAGNGPAADVLTPHGEPDRLRGVGVKPVETGGHATRVEQLLRLLYRIDHLEMWVLAVRSVEPLDRPLEPAARTGRSNRPWGEDAGAAIVFRLPACASAGMLPRRAWPAGRGALRNTV